MSGFEDLFGVFLKPQEVKNAKSKLENEEKPKAEVVEKKVVVEEVKDAKISPPDEEMEDGGNKRVHEPMDEDEDDTDLKKARLEEDIESLESFLPKVTLLPQEVPDGCGCTHTLAVPHGTFQIPREPVTDPVKIFQFKLDFFQERAVECIDNYQSVLVSAHTSAGKTVVAEYAIAKGLKDGQRVIYTTPIKALSNQKYREFYEEFKDVGLITGDVSINPSASCIIMTTEILRNMLYRGSEVMREVGWVVFDEIHYMRDKERGVVWEETIILLPEKTHYVFLSATIPNAGQFAEWISHLHKQPCNVIHTDFRPVPLYHYLFPVSGEGIHLVVDDKGSFKEDNFSLAMARVPKDTPGGQRKSWNKTNQKAEDSPCHRVIKMAMENDLSPLIVFSFSKKDCEIYALQMSKLDFATPEEKELTREIFTNAIDVLSKEDQKLPQVENILPLLLRGIGIHHGGLLPLLKESVELLFFEGLIKVLFATETFAMGLNMPAKTVLFTNVRKFDGKNYRWLSSGEYIQMSGRAGRRGIDDKGVSIVMLEEKISPAVGRALLRGSADPLNSAFHLTYNMVLNLMRVEEINPEFMMERSFYQFQNYASIPVVCDKLRKAQEQWAAIEISRMQEISSYYRIRMQLKNLTEKFKAFITKPAYVLPFLTPGRLIYVKDTNNDFGWGVVVNFKKQEMVKEENPLECTVEFIIDALLEVDAAGASVKSTAELSPSIAGKRSEPRIVPITIAIIKEISQIRLYISNDLRPTTTRLAILKSIHEVKKRFPDGVPILNPCLDFNITDPEFATVQENIRKFEKQLKAHSLNEDLETPMLFELYEKKAALKDRVVEAKKELKVAKSLLQMDELKCRKRVLRRLGYCSQDDVIELKGRVACEITSADELLLTEMLFNGIFIELTVAQCVALLSCFVCDERSNEKPKLTEELAGPLKIMQDVARQIVKLSKESKLEIDEDAYVDQFKPFLMDVVHAWCCGSTFANLCSMTDIFEGGIIRCMRRLEELLRQMSLAAKVIGNKDLEDKFCDGVKCIKRDIAFAASLYL